MTSRNNQTIWTTEEMAKRLFIVYSWQDYLPQCSAKRSESWENILRFKELLRSPFPVENPKGVNYFQDLICYVGHPQLLEALIKLIIIFTTDYFKIHNHYKFSNDIVNVEERRKHSSAFSVLHGKYVNLNYSS